MNTKSLQSFFVGFLIVVFCVACFASGYWFLKRETPLVTPFAKREAVPDIGIKVRDESRPSMWNSSNMMISGTDYMVTAGAHLYQDESDLVWDFYSIEIGKMAGGKFETWFSRELEMDVVGDEIAKKKVSEYVEFDAETRVVRIDLGKQILSYQLPEIYKVEE